MATDPNAPDFGADPDKQLEHLDQTEKNDVATEGDTFAEAEDEAKRVQGDTTAPQGDA